VETGTSDWLAKTGLKFAEGATDTGVVVSWNTEGPANQNEKNMTLAPGGISINPINWKRDDTPAEETQMFGPESYHLHDYGLFFNNFKQNVADRIKAYMEKK
jgi:hypothetical protein